MESYSPIRTPSSPARLCVSVTGTTLAELLQRSASLAQEFPFQELRLDYLDAPRSFGPSLRDHLTEHPDLTLLATCRRLAAGGRFRGDPEAELTILLEAAATGCRIVDLSIESAEALPPNAIPRLRQQGARVLLSWHNFQATGDLRAVYARMQPFAPDIYKIVPTARTLVATLPLFELLRAHGPSGPAEMVGISMGEAGSITRVLGVRAGSAFTFAAADPSGSTAPGQIDAHTLRDRYRLDSLDANIRLYGVAGSPVSSSMSPAMLNAAFAHASYNAVYVPLLTEDATELFRVAEALPLAGFSVTMPLKQAVLPYLNVVDPLARRIGAVNTVRREPDGSFSGFNTDVAGIVQPLEARLELRGARVLVLGAGGAARAAVFGCADRGADVFLLNRNYERAASLAVEAGAKALRREDLPDLPAFDAIVNATPAGMRGNTTSMPLEPEELRAKLVFDMVYNPQDPPLLQAARERGLQIIPGVEMFVRQGAKQYEFWTGTTAPVEEMRRIVLDTLALQTGRAAGR